VKHFLVALEHERAELRADRAPARHAGCLVLARGHLSNAAELRGEARRRGEAPPPDDEALLALAYRWWGDALQEHVLGEYAVAVYDERERRLLLTHDALGIVPCFFADLPARLVAGSRLADVARAAGVADGPVDDEYVADQLALGRPAGGRTPYPAVRRLLPGRTLTGGAGRVRELTTWSLGNVRPVRLASDADYEQRCRELLAQAVRAALGDAGTAWCELSGGLDSSSVISVAATACERRLPAVSLIYEQSKTGDERPWMEAVVRRYELPWQTIDADAYPPFALLPEVAFDEPNASMPVWPLFRRYEELLAEHGVEVVLTGTGGDHIFAGDTPAPRHLSDPLLRLDPLGFARGLRDWNRRSPARRSLLHWLGGNVVWPALRHARGQSVLDDAGPNFALPEWLDPRFARALALDRRPRRRYAPRCRFVGDQFFAEALHVIGTIAGTNREAVSESFAFRNPLLHRPLVEFMFAVPWEQRLEPDRERSLQRRALLGILPEKVRLRRGKRGVQQAYFEGLRRNGAWLDMLRHRPQIVERGYVDGRAWRDAVEQARFGRTPSMRHFLAAATLECWLNRRDHPFHAASPSSQGVPDERSSTLFHA
jgi:asparagine synthase (glutamine-hydrolysing)